MSEEVVQWLAEIRRLKQELAEAERDRDTAQASADHWRVLYNTEARQRRQETQLAQKTILSLQDHLQQQQEPAPRVPTDAPRMAAFAAELAPLKTESQLRNKLIECLYERDRAKEALKNEQENHRQTRQNLTAIIGDTMDQLTRLRGDESTAAQRGRASTNPASADQVVDVASILDSSLDLASPPDETSA